MKAIRVHQFGGPEVLQLEEVREPKPGLTQVLIRARAIGVNPVETYLRSGSNPKLPLPYTPGTDAAGEVIERGAAVHDIAVGARVYTSDTVSGSYGEWVLCEATDAHHLPDKITFAQGAAMNIPYATAYRALFQRGQAIPGETVLIHGASGGVGTAAIQLARAAGLRIIATAGSTPGRALAQELGAHHVIDHHSPDAAAQVQKLAPQGVNIILEMLANVNLGQDLTLLARHGRVIVIGSRGKVEIDAREAMKRDADIRGIMLFLATPEEKAAIHAALGAGLENGSLRPVISREIPLAQAAEAHRLIMAGGAAGKIVLTP
ncbi:MAG TPA: NADPH:quinone reductase [Verrucomicrobiae bacterium]|jgi:NADPH2:quinone reductase|nr:NADPH:quinone reductase [Verrucomicrobiae bacterium]